MGYFFLVASLVLLFMQVIIGLWFYWIFPAIGWKFPVVIIPVLLTVFIRLTMAYTRTHYGTLESVAYYLAYIWAGLIFIFFSLAVIFALIQALCLLLHLPAQNVLKWTSVAVLIAVTVLSLWGGFATPALRHIYLQIPGAPSLTAAVISDTHLGQGVSLARWQKALQQINAQRPDIILVLGDVFEYGMNRRAYAEELAALKTPLGTYGVLGNHEYYMGYQNSVDFYKQAGIELLQNQTITLPNTLQLIGVKDIKTASVTAAQLDNLLAQTNPDSPRILLSHQPLLTDVAAKHNIPLMLSGHTHAGQIWPFNFLVKLFYAYVYGLHEIGPASKIYVTSGMFYWGIPLRLFAPAEIPFIHIN